MDLEDAQQMCAAFYKGQGTDAGTGAEEVEMGDGGGGGEEASAEMGGGGGPLIPIGPDDVVQTADQYVMELVNFTQMCL